MNTTTQQTGKTGGFLTGMRDHIASWAEGAASSVAGPVAVAGIVTAGVAGAIIATGLGVVGPVVAVASIGACVGGAAGATGAFLGLGCGDILARTAGQPARMRPVSHAFGVASPAVAAVATGIAVASLMPFSSTETPSAPEADKTATVFNVAAPDCNQKPVQKAIDGLRAQGFTVTCGLPGAESQPRP